MFNSFFVPKSIHCCGDIIYEKKKNLKQKLYSRLKSKKLKQVRLKRYKLVFLIKKY